MTKRTLIALTILLAFGFIKANAGWYECYNFSGTIDRAPITLSVQMIDGYFGEKEKKDFNVIGVYKYEKNGAPIRLEGKRNFSNNKVVLYEISGKKQTAAFEFDFSENESAGFRTNLLTGEKLPLNLKYVSKVSDLRNISKVADATEENHFADVEVLQTNSLKDFYFIGVYAKNKNQDDAAMTELKIIRKKDNTLFQTLNFSKIETGTGNLMTVIFDNVDANNKSQNFTVSNKIGRVGGYLTVNYNLKKKRFVLNPKARIDGPDE